MRVVSWNIELGREVDTAAQELRTAAELSTADVLLVQEMDPDGVARLAELLDMDFRYEWTDHHPFTHAPFGNAVLSRWEMSEAVAVPLPHSVPFAGVGRCAVMCTVDVDGEVVRAASVHLETALLPLRLRMAQVATMLERFPAGDTSRPLVVGGDFNTASLRSLRRTDGAMTDAGLVRLTSAALPTFRRFNRDFTLDHLYGEQLRVRDSGVVPDVASSDHYPIWAEVAADNS